MLKFLREHEVAAAFKMAHRKDKRANIAVAFWGVGAAKKLGLQEGTDVRVICNLSHIGCNPKAIEELRRLRIVVKTHPRLHGKVYTTATMAIVGSSNASTNGLTVEGDEAIGWKEGNLLTDDTTVVAEALAFFDELWVDPEAHIVTKFEIDAALSRRATIPLGVLNPPNARTLVAACRERPEAFSNVIIYAYERDLSQPFAEALADFKKRAVAPKPSSDRLNFKRAWGYEGGGIPAGHWIVDLDCKSKSRAPRIWGCSLSYGIEIEVADEILTITRRGVVSLGGRRFPLSAAEKAFLEAAAPQILQASRKNHVSLVDAIRMADLVANSSVPKNAD